jgi:DNA-binding MarR family transcriptional regulator
MEPVDVRTAPARLRAMPSWLINQAGLHATRLVAAELATEGARRQHYAPLATLAEVGPASQAELSRRTAIDGSDMVATLNELADEGYVERSPDPDDRRRNVVTITPAGRRYLDRLDRILGRAQDQLLAPLSAADRTRLVSLLTQVLEDRSA